MSQAADSTDTGARRASSRARRLLFLAALAFAAADLVAKVVAESRLNETSVDLGVLQLQLAHNDGVAFSLGNSLPSSVVLALTAALTGGMALYGWRHAPTANRVQLIAGAAILGGATANVIDRAGDGVVTDYLHTGWWPTFNLADAFLVFGVIALVAGQLNTERRSSASTLDDPDRDSSTDPAPSEERGPDRTAES